MIIGIYKWLSLCDGRNERPPISTYDRSTERSFFYRYQRSKSKVLQRLGLKFNYLIIILRIYFVSKYSWKIISYCVCVWVSMYVSVCVYKCMHVYMWVYVGVYASMCMFVCECIYVRFYVFMKFVDVKFPFSF